MGRTIQDILDRVDWTTIGSIELDYDGDLTEFESEWDIPNEIRDEEATYRIKRYNNKPDVLKIKVR